MYSQLLQNYENVKDDYSLLRKRYDDLVASHSAAVSKLEHSQVSYTLFWIMHSTSFLNHNVFPFQILKMVGGDYLKMISIFKKYL